MFTINLGRLVLSYTKHVKTTTWPERCSQANEKMTQPFPSRFLSFLLSFRVSAFLGFLVFGFSCFRAFRVFAFLRFRVFAFYVFLQSSFPFWHFRVFAFLCVSQKQFPVFAFLRFVLSRFGLLGSCSKAHFSEKSGLHGQRKTYLSATNNGL